MRRLALMSVAASALLGGASLAIAQTPPAPIYYNPTYYKVPYYQPPPSLAQVTQIFVNAGYLNPTDLVLESGVWKGKATMENHQVAVAYDRQGIWQLTK